MKFLIDESVEKAIVDWLRDRKYDVMYVAESSPFYILFSPLSFLRTQESVLLVSSLLSG